MKRICAFTSIFVVTFLIVAGAVIFTDDVTAATRHCKYTLPCAIEDIYCTSTPCTGTCYPYGGLFYCASNPTKMYCSGDYYYPVPCGN